MERRVIFGQWPVLALARHPAYSRVVTRTLKTSELREGDIVLEHGMRVRLDSGVRTPESEHGTVYSRPGTVLNLDEVREAKIIPPSFLGDGEKWVEGRGWTTDRDDSWTVQGNDLAHWTVEVRVTARNVKITGGNHERHQDHHRIGHRRCTRGRGHRVGISELTTLAALTAPRSPQFASGNICSCVCRLTLWMRL